MLQGYDFTGLSSANLAYFSASSCDTSVVLRSVLLLETSLELDKGHEDKVNKATSAVDSKTSYPTFSRLILGRSGGFNEWVYISQVRIFHLGSILRFLVLGGGTVAAAATGGDAAAFRSSAASFCCC